MNSVVEPRARRLLSASYDSVTQRELTPSLGDREQTNLLARHILTARMRLDVILSGQIVATDAMVLDGALFASVSPEELTRDVAVLPTSQPSLVVRARASSLEECILGFVTDVDGFIRPFEFSLLEAEKRSRFTAYLVSKSKEGLMAPRSLGGLVQHFRSAGLDEDDYGDAVAHWTRWIAFLEQGSNGGVITAEHFNPHQPGLNMAQAVELQDLDAPAWHSGGASPSSLEQVLDDVRAMVNSRQPRTALYDHIRVRHLTEYDEQLALLYVDRIFGFAFREQHECEDLATDWLLPLRPVSSAGGSEPGASASTMEQLAEVGLSTILMPSDFLARLALAHAADLQVWAYEESTALRCWRDEEDQGQSLKAAMRHLEEVLSRTISPARIELQLLGRAPSARSWTRTGRLSEYIKRHGPNTVSEGVGIAADLAGVGTLKSVVALIAAPVREAQRNQFGNPSVITTDIGMPRRRTPRSTNPR